MTIQGHDSAGEYCRNRFNSGMPFTLWLNRRPKGCKLLLTINSSHGGQNYTPFHSLQGNNERMECRHELPNIPSGPALRSISSAGKSACLMTGWTGSNPVCSTSAPAHESSHSHIIIKFICVGAEFVQGGERTAKEFTERKKGKRSDTTAGGRPIGNKSKVLSKYRSRR